MILISALLCASLAAMAQVRVTTPETEMVLKADSGSDLKVLYYGARLSDADVAGLEAAGAAWVDAYPAYGFHCAGEAFARAGHVRSAPPRHRRRHAGAGHLCGADPVSYTHLTLPTKA